MPRPCLARMSFMLARSRSGGSSQAKEYKATVGQELVVPRRCLPPDCFHLKPETNGVFHFGNLESVVRWQHRLDNVHDDLLAAGRGGRSRIAQKLVYGRTCSIVEGRGALVVLCALANQEIVHI
ncbi:hypothetical protein DMN91_003401 [Ooceraea biroi]|uniref:Uncharacterized protein n=1 Tax=Ooceraea biroi TaxID=2015173 RepID=A0A3L8DTX6_OOCBI|nr:hypothetical protein DMN91_003401 [Ooceraea biroi]